MIEQNPAAQPTRAQRALHNLGLGLYGALTATFIATAGFVLPAAATEAPEDMQEKMPAEAVFLGSILLAYGAGAMFRRECRWGKPPEPKTQTPAMYG